MLLGQLRSITAQARRSLPCQSAFQASSQAPPASQAGAWTPAAAACRHRGPHRRAFSARELSLANERYLAWKAGRAKGIAFVLAVKGKTLASMRSRSTVAPAQPRSTAPEREINATDQKQHAAAQGFTPGCSVRSIVPDPLHCLPFLL